MKGENKPCRNGRMKLQDSVTANAGVLFLSLSYTTYTRKKNKKKIKHKNTKKNKTRTKLYYIIILYYTILHYIIFLICEFSIFTGTGAFIGMYKKDL